MALTFNGTSSNLIVANPLVTAYPFSMFGWIKPANTTQDSFAFGAGDTTFKDAEFLLYVNGGGSGKMRAWIGSGQSSGSAVSTTSIGTAWQPVLMVFGSSSSADIYYASGAKVNVNPGLSVVFGSMTRFVIGANSTAAGFFFSGDQAEIAVWSSALVQADFDALAAGALPETVQSSTLVESWSLQTQAATQTGTKGRVLTNGASTTQAGTHPISRTADTTAPTLASAAVSNSTPTIVTLTMSEAMDTYNVPAASAFTVTGHTVSSVSISGSTISLTCSAAFVNGEAARTVSYTQPGTANARDVAGNLLANFSAQAITNNVSATDTTKPTFSSAQVADAAKTDIVITMSETLAAFTPATTAFAASGGRTVTGVSRSGATVTVTVNTPYAYGDTITITYTKPGSNMLQDAAGNQTDTFAARSVTNNISAPTGVFTTDQWINNTGTLRANEAVTYTWYAGGAIGSAGGTATTGSATLSSLGVLSLSGLTAGAGYLLGKSNDGGVFYQAGTVA